MREKQLPDWQLGNESKTTPLERVELMNEWLKQNKKEILEKLEEEPQEEKIVGFIDL